MIQNLKENCPNIYINMSDDIIKELVDIQLDLVELNFAKIYGQEIIGSEEEVIAVNKKNLETHKILSEKYNIN